VGKEVWIGRVKVRPAAGNDIFDGAPGAFANALTSADSLRDYRLRVETAFAHERLSVAEVDDAEPLRERMSRVHVSDEIVELGGKLVMAAWSGTPSTFSTQTTLTDVALASFRNAGAADA